MDTIEMIWIFYGFIGIVTFIWETMEGGSAWYGIASGILWPVFPLREAVKIIIGLFR
jgi:hypothetical protein